MDKKSILGGCVEIFPESKKAGFTEIVPHFRVRKSHDLMIRGGDFYAVWIEQRKLWSTDEDDLLELIDAEIYAYSDAYKKSCLPGETVIPRYMREAENGMIDRWRKYVKGQARDYYHALDERLVFSNEETKKSDFATKKLPYPLAECDISAYNTLIGTLYSEEERHKLEWAIGAVVSGDSRKIQKFVALYGAGGTGKSTVLRIIEKLFTGYCATFDAKALGSSSGTFALEAFRNNPLVAIEDDSKLDKIEDNTRLNSLIAHETMIVNEKFKSQYEQSFKAFLFVGTNTPVKITDAKSGLIRRLIDISPTGNTIKPKSEYQRLMNQIDFELGGIASHCLDVYQANPTYYDGYIPKNMMAASNDFYNFVANYYFEFKENNGTTLSAAWKLYKDYIEMANLQDRLGMTKFREELKNYFSEYQDRTGVMENGKRVRSYYSGFRNDIFDRKNSESQREVDEPPEDSPSWLDFKVTESELDKVGADWPAQYGSAKETPAKNWSEVTTTLKDLDTSKLHYVLLPKNHIVIDFDIVDENGNKSLAENLKEASKWPQTYAELSKSGNGIHLHYIYDGDPQKLAKEFAPKIEIKVSTGKSSLRRKLTRCTMLGIAHIGSGLPFKGGKPPMLNNALIKSERGIRRQIERNLNREIHANTKPSIDMINKILEDAYASGVQYDVSDMRNAVFGFAAGSSHQRTYCMNLVAQMKFKSKSSAESLPDTYSRQVAFFDCEVFPNLLVICWKLQGPDQEVHAMINPSPQLVEDFIDTYDLIGFNNRRYDNHIIYARSIGVSIEGIYKLSDSIINHKTGFIPNAYDISYTDIYDYSSKKQGLKKFEIDLKIDHRELDLPWDEPVPEDRWEEVVAYCKNDVIATEKVHESRKADFAGRKILAKLAGGSVNDTTNTLSAKFIFQGDRNPQGQFNYRFMGNTDQPLYRSKIDAEKGIIYNNFGDEYTLFDAEGRPVFKSYEFTKQTITTDQGASTTVYKSTYRGEEVGEGGYVYAEPGIYRNVALLDIESMHPHSAIAEQLFGEYYTARFKEIVDARLAIKHKDIALAKTLLNGELSEYLEDPELLNGLKQALKIVINSVYGLTSAKFMNPFRDNRNEDNIVAKRGALFMVNLKHEVQKRGFTVAHIKTDSIKIPDATPEIIKFVQDYGEQYGYHFLHEATYDRMCLVNDAVYIAKYCTVEDAEKQYGYIPSDINEKSGEWTATGTQFAVPYVFKTLFSHEPIEFDDLCETKSVNSALYLDMNESLEDGEHLYHFVGRVGRFCPIKHGCGGGELLRQGENKKTGEKTYSYATGTKGWRWLEAETVLVNHWEDNIDVDYYQRLVDDAAKAIEQYCSLKKFCGQPDDITSTIPFDDCPPWEYAEPADIFQK